MELFNEGNEVSFRRLIAYLWTIVVCVLFLLAFAFNRQVPDGTVIVTGIVWGFYFAKNSPYLNKDGKKQE